MLTNADIGELLWVEARDEPGHRRTALERASRAARFWPGETCQIADAGRSLTELRAVGPWVAARSTGQDLNVEMARLARSEGVRWFSIGSDAHSANELDFLPFGMATAALAGIQREWILNYRPVDFVRSWAEAMPATVDDRS